MASYAETFPAPSKGAGVADRRRHEAVREERARLERQGWKPARVCNYHAFPLRLDLGELGKLECPARTASGPGTLEITVPRLSMRDRGDGVYDPLSVLPIELAREFLREFAGIGGVVVHDGPGAGPDAAAGAAAEASRLAWMRREIAKAQDAWSRYRQNKFIDDRQRLAARELLERGELSALPEWATAGVVSDARACPECGETIKSAALRCRFCGAALVKEEADAQDAPNTRRRK